MDRQTIFKSAQTSTRVDGRYLRWLFGVVLVGIAIGTTGVVSPTAMLSLAVAGLIFGVSGWADRSSRRIGIIAFVFALSIFRGAGAHQSVPINDISNQNGKKIEFIAMVDAPPEEKTQTTQLTVSVSQIRAGETVRPSQGRVLISAPTFVSYHYGDQLKISCRLTAPQSSPTFAYDEFLATSGIYSLCSFPAIQRIDSQGPEPFQTLYWLRSSLLTLINRSMSEPQAGLAAGLLLGVRSSLPPTFKAALQSTGTSHLVAVSGTNITIVTMLFLNGLLAAGFHRRQAFWFVSAAVIGFVIIVGFPASAVRAGIMGWLVLFAVYLGRPSQIWHGLLLAAAVMTIVNPLLPLHDIGFQLSFAAVIGLVLLGPPLTERLQLLPSWGGIRESIAMTVAAQATTAPLLWFHFSSLSLSAVIINGLVAPLIIYAMAATAIGCVVVVIIPAASAIAFFPAWFLSSLIITIITAGAQLPFGFIQL